MRNAIRILAILFLLIAIHPGYCDVGTLSGNVKTDAAKSKQNQVVDSDSGSPVGGARVSIPGMGYNTNTDSDGRFDIDTDVKRKSIMSVEKEGYRPFSITIDETTSKKPLKLGISQSQSGDIVIESSLCHLGDDIYADTSANAGEFKTKAVGPFYTNRFKCQRPKMNEDAILIFGSVIGLDTKRAKELGQNKISQVYASPAEVYFNGNKIGELHINGDNQEIMIPPQLITEDAEVTIKTGRNLFQQAYIDYDDMEFMNLRIELRERPLSAGF